MNSAVGVDLWDELGLGSSRKNPAIIIVGSKNYRLLGGLEARMSKDTPVYMIPLGVGG
jgi:hypothetical protein